MNDSFRNIHFGDKFSFQRNMDDEFKKLHIKCYIKEQPSRVGCRKDPWSN